MENNLSRKEWVKKYPHNFFVTSCKTEQAYQRLRAELHELTKGGNYECVYELAQMEGCDTDDIFELIGY